MRCIIVKVNFYNFPCYCSYSVVFIISVPKTSYSFVFPTPIVSSQSISFSASLPHTIIIIIHLVVPLAELCSVDSLSFVVSVFLQINWNSLFYSWSCTTQFVSICSSKTIILWIGFHLSSLFPFHLQFF